MFVIIMKPYNVIILPLISFYDIIKFRGIIQQQKSAQFFWLLKEIGRKMSVCKAMPILFFILHLQFCLPFLFTN